MSEKLGGVFYSKNKPGSSRFTGVVAENRVGTFDAPELNKTGDKTGYWILELSSSQTKRYVKMVCDAGGGIAQAGGGENWRLTEMEVYG